MFSRDIQPEWRWIALLKAAEKGHPPKQNAYLARVYDVVVGKTQDRDIEYALDLVRIQEHKEILQAFFYCETPIMRISQVLEIDVPVLEHVEKLVMDRRQFRNKLERIRYVDNLLNDENALTPKGRECIQLGLAHGPDILAYHFRLGDEAVQIDAKKMIEHFAITAYYLSANARNNPLTADTTKQARMWMLDVIKYVEARKEADGGADANRDALFAIEERRATLSVEELGVDPSDIMH